MLHSHNQDHRMPSFIWASDFIAGLVAVLAIFAVALVLGLFDEDRASTQPVPHLTGETPHDFRP